MARAYPRFLFSDPKNIKSAGPFIVHLLHPRLVFIVNFHTDSSTDPKHLELIHGDKSAEDDVVANNIKHDAEVWLRAQLKSGTIKLA